MRLTDSGVYRNLLTAAQLAHAESWYLRQAAREHRDAGAVERAAALDAEAAEIEHIAERAMA